ncbi:MAG: NAD-dependent epimerase/dehydratase family protein [Prolixibacteraceae bacterium]|nr:NAD-dependent epimerase/dehydratase family protein [Prolixibacteraceae bacterium]
MIKVGITGQAGFIGTHLFNFLGLKPNEITRIPFEDAIFSDQARLEEFVKKCDVIVHLAALNRHNDPQEIYNTNLRLVKQLIGALETTGSKPHILFSSSIQEERTNIFGKSKREGRQLLAEWAERNGAIFTGMVIPNVFGPFGNPYYNSVVATFSHQLTHNEEPKVEVDAQLRMIYIGDLVKDIYDCIKRKVNNTEYKVAHTNEVKVSEILELLKGFKSDYFDKGIFPDLTDPLERNLFNTFVCYIDLENYFPFRLKLNTDERGSFVETVKINSGGQVSFSTTKPGISRGNHFHTRKAERFAVIKGKARIQLRRIGTDKILNFELDGKEPAYVDMPVWYTHNIKNIGTDDLYTIFWINEFYNNIDTDTYYEMV